MLFAVLDFWDTYTSLLLCSNLFQNLYFSPGRWSEIGGCSCFLESWILTKGLLFCDTS